MSIPLLSSLQNRPQPQEKRVPLPTTHHDLGRQGVTATLAQRSAEHDKLLPQYPVPAYNDIVQATLENAVVLDLLENFDNGQHANISGHSEKVTGSFASSLGFLGGETEVNYVRAAKKFVDMNSTSTSTAWATNAFKKGLLMQRGPLCEGTLAWLIHSPTKNQVDAAARLLHALAAMYMSPMTMQAYGANQKFETKQLVEMFATSRIPGEAIDELKTHPSSTHVVVWFKGRAYKLHILDSSRGRPIPTSVLANYIESILSAPQEEPKQSTVASWSTLRTRAEWAARRQKIISTNPMALNDLESAITSVALHSFQPESDKAQLKHAKSDPCDVYADKTLGFSVFSGGAIAVRGEHAAADGGPFGQLMTMLDQTLKSTPKTIRTIPEPVKLVELEFGTAEDDSVAIYQLPPLYSATKSRHFLLFQDDDALLGLLRSSRLLNFILQLAYQNALLSLGDSPGVCIVEPTSVRNFAEGRCNANYVMTKESLEFCQNLRGSAPSKKLFQSFILAFKKYKELQKWTRQGAGFSFGLIFLANSVQALPQSEEKSTALKTLSVLMKKPAYFTGSGHGESIRASEGFVFQLDQISLVYVGHADKVNVCVTGSGKFQNCLKAIQTSMEQSVAQISSVAAAVNGSEDSC
jgi:hypothetical protein